METRTPKAADLIEAMGLLIEAPGFTPETFAAGVTRARKDGYFHFWPGQAGSVLVETARSDGAVYRVTRSECSCQGGQSHGHCKHRAAAIFISDFEGIDLCHAEILGFDPEGHSVTADARLAHLGKVA